MPAFKEFRICSSPGRGRAAWQSSSNSRSPDAAVTSLAAEAATKAVQTASSCELLLAAVSSPGGSELGRHFPKRTQIDEDGPIVRAPLDGLLNRSLLVRLTSFFAVHDGLLHGVVQYQFDHPAEDEALDYSFDQPFALEAAQDFSNVLFALLRRNIECRNDNIAQLLHRSRLLQRLPNFGADTSQTKVDCSIEVENGDLAVDLAGNLIAGLYICSHVSSIAEIASRRNVLPSRSDSQPSNACTAKRPRTSGGAAWTSGNRAGST